jgi:hypothetical protein
MSKSKSISKSKLSFVSTVAALTILPATPAFAYLDPGNGSMLLQLLLGGAAGAAVIVRIYWQRLKSMFSFKKPPQSKD